MVDSDDERKPGEGYFEQVPSAPPLPEHYYSVNGSVINLCDDPSFDLILDALNKTGGSVDYALISKFPILWGMHSLRTKKDRDIDSQEKLRSLLQKLFQLIQTAGQLEITDTKNPMQHLRHQLVRFTMPDRHESLAHNVLSEALLSTQLLPDCLGAIRTLDLEDQSLLFEACRSTVTTVSIEKALQDCHVADASCDYYLIELAHEIISRSNKKDSLSVDLLVLYNELTRCIADLKKPENAANRSLIHTSRIQALLTTQESCKNSTSIQFLLKRLQQSMFVDKFSTVIASEAAADEEKRKENRLRWAELQKAVLELNPDFWNQWFKPNGLKEDQWGLPLDEQASVIINNPKSLLTETYIQFHRFSPSIITRLWAVMKTWSARDQETIMKQCEKELSKDFFSDLERILAQEKYVTDESLMDYFELSNEELSNESMPKGEPKQEKLQQLICGVDNPLVLAAQNNPEQIPDLLQKLAQETREEQLACLKDFANQYPSIVAKTPGFRESPYFRKLVDRFAKLKNEHAIQKLDSIQSYKKRRDSSQGTLSLPSKIVTMNQQIEWFLDRGVDWYKHPISWYLEYYTQDELVNIIELIRTYPPKSIYNILEKNANIFSLFLRQTKSGEALLSVMKELKPADKIRLHTVIFNELFSLSYDWMPFCMYTDDNQPQRYNESRGHKFLRLNEVFMITLNEIRLLPSAERYSVLLHMYRMLPRQGSKAIYVLCEIKGLDYEHQSIFLKEMEQGGVANEMSTDPIARRDFHLIELAAKVHEYHLGVNTTQNSSEKKRYQAAETGARELHQMLLKLSSYENNRPENIQKTQAEWLEAVARAKLTFQKIDNKGNLNIKGLLNRLWYSMKRVTGFVLTPHALLDNLSAQAPSLNMNTDDAKIKRETASSSSLNSSGFMPLVAVMRDSTASLEVVSQQVFAVNRLGTVDARSNVLSHYVSNNRDVSFLIKLDLKNALPLVKEHFYVLELERILHLSNNWDPKYKALHAQLLKHLLDHEKKEQPTQKEQEALRLLWERAIKQSKIGPNRSWSSRFWGADGKGSPKDLYKRTLVQMKEHCCDIPQCKLPHTPSKS
ncbi:MAG TPA: hypothetical protein DDY37_02955 [Legionella sp.]|nr:hypothetical protein [Legionella sp.]